MNMAFISQVAMAIPEAAPEPAKPEQKNGKKLGCRRYITIQKTSNTPPPPPFSLQIFPSTNSHKSLHTQSIQSQTNLTKWFSVNSVPAERRDQYKEYHSVCPFVCIGWLPPPRFHKRVCVPPVGSWGGTHSLTVEGVGGANSDDRPVTLALCILCGFQHPLKQWILRGDR